MNKAESKDASDMLKEIDFTSCIMHMINKNDFVIFNSKENLRGHSETMFR